jgi:hypothetical protein
VFVVRRLTPLDLLAAGTAWPARAAAQHARSARRGIADLEWKIIYVGCAEDSKHDQELDSVLVGPIAVGKHKFVFQVRLPATPARPHADG